MNHRFTSRKLDATGPSPTVHTIMIPSSASSSARILSYPMPRSEHWDCTSLGLDLTSLALSVGGNAAVACIPESAGLCGVGAVTLRSARFATTIASLAHTVDMVSRGKAGPVDLTVNLYTTRLGKYPIVGEVAGVGQFLYDFIVDPITPSGW